MDPGQLDQIATWYGRTSTPDGQGGSTYSWSTPITALTNIACKVVEVSARERYFQRVKRSGRVIKITVRWDPLYTLDQRVIWDSTSFSITGVQHLQYREWLSIDAVEVEGT